MKTKFGSAKIFNEYYTIKSRGEGNHNKLLHRLIFEDFYGCKIPKGYNIHHKDGNKLNNCILNLELIKKSDHTSLHKKGKNNHFYGVKGENHPRYNKPHSKEDRIKISKSFNKTGILNVSTAKDKTYKNGFKWIYAYYENKKHKIITSANLIDLKEKVIAKNLEWIVVDLDKVKNICEKWDYELFNIN